jgi:ABC-type thiamine transport system ATPase subunit
MMSGPEFTGWHLQLTRMAEVVCLFPLDDMLALVQQSRRIAEEEKPEVLALAGESMDRMEANIRAALALKNARIAARGDNQDLIKRNQAVAQEFLARL